MKKFLYFIGILFSSLMVIVLVMGGLFMLLVWLPAQKEGREEPVQLECTGGRNTYLCLIQGFLKPKPRDIDGL